MEESKKKASFFLTFLKAYWWAFLIILVTPVLVNFIVLLPAFLPIVGGSSEWLSFHGSYIGSVIASMITLFVLYKQLQHNHQENEQTRKENQIVNEKNRLLQLNILKYEQSRQWLTELKVKMTDYYMAFSFHDVRNLGDLIIVEPYPSDLAAYKKHIQEIIKHILIKMEYADLAKGILFYKMDDDETMYLTQLKSFTNELYSLLEDLDWFARSVCFYAGTAEINIGIYKRETEKYKGTLANFRGIM